MCRTPSLKSLLVVAGMMFIFPNATQAAYAAQTKTCDSVGKYDGPAANIPFDLCSQDCGCPEMDSARFFDELDNYSSVVCVDNPELVAKVAKPTNISLTGTGKASYNFSFIDSFAIDPEKQQLLDSEQLNLLLPALNLPDRFDDSFSDALCVYESKFDRQACAQYLGSTLFNGVSENILATSWFSKRTTSIETQFETKKKRLAQIVRCIDKTASETEACDQNYTVVKATGETASEVAHKYYQISYQEFKALPQEEQMKILSIRETRASSPVCVVVKDTATPNPNYWTKLILPTTEKVNYLCGYIPGVAAVRDATKTMMQTLTTQAVGTKTINDITTALKKPTSGTSTEARLLNKVENAINNDHLDCTISTSKYQSMGSQGPSRNDKPSLDISWFFQILSPEDDSLTPMTHVYQAYLIGPTEMIAQFMGTHSQAVMKNLFPASLTASVGESSYLPQALTSESPTASTDDHWTDSEGNDCNPGEEGCQNNKVEFVSKDKSGNAQNVNAPLQGGAAVTNVLAVGHKLAWAKNSASYFTSMCWANELAQKMQTNPILKGVPLFSLIGRTVDGALTNCPTDFAASSKPSTDCGGTMGKALTSASGACQLCNTDQLTGNYVIPPKMKQVIESAAQENNVPASIILAILAAEGGFNDKRVLVSTCYGEKWTDELVCTTKLPNCDSCNVSSEGSKGPFQIIAKWFPESKFGSACNFTDAARTIASNHRTEKDGNPCWVKGTTDPVCAGVDPQYQDVVKSGNTYLCAGHPVNVGGSQGDQTCDSWTEQDVATAARAYRGMCDKNYIDTVINYWKKYTCN